MSTINAVVTKKSPIAFDLFTKTLTIHELFELTLAKTGYLTALNAEGQEGKEE